VDPRRPGWLVLAAAFAACVGSVAAAASVSQVRPAGAPDLAAMALAAGDFPAGARVVGQRYYRNPDFVASYEREFSLGGTRVGRSTLLVAFAGLDVEPVPAEARATFGAVRTLFASRRFRNSFAKEIAREADLAAGSVKVGRPRTPRIGDGALGLSVTLLARRTSVQMAVTFVRVDRVLGSLVLIGLPGKKVFAADADRLTRASVDRIRGGLVPASSTPEPSVVGSAILGQTLSARDGGWTGDQVQFTYQWERCADTNDSSCAPIAGATAPTYTVTTGDLASRLRFVVTGRNRLGSDSATSPSTAFASGQAGAPSSTAPPLVEGVVGPGAALAVTTGMWTGAPESFAYQWRRCNSTTGACLDVTGATESTYTLSAADSGSLLRVLVVATNASGSGGALSAPTAPAP
jgi:hypothetical protein